MIELPSASTPIPPALSAKILAMLVSILLLATWVFLSLVHRTTRGRAWVALREWAGEHQMKLRSRVNPPDALLTMTSQRAQALVLLEGERVWMARLRADSGEWHVLVRRCATEWPTVALRPVIARASVIDGIELSRSNSLSTERFAILSADPRAGAVLAASHAAALVPPDIGLLRKGQDLLLDFSTRPFDPIELGRMTTLADQLAAMM
ncbi:MAG: hypothetical protein ACREJC_18595 [Tepidisphaeraceae bacterium]